MGLPGKSILGDYFEENRTSRRPFLLLRIRFPGRPIFIQLPPATCHFQNHVNTEYADNKEYVRAQYERAMYACGREWRSDKLWDKYQKWEVTEAKDLCKALKL